MYLRNAKHNNYCALDLTLLTCGNPTLPYEQNEIIFKHVFEYIKRSERFPLHYLGITCFTLHYLGIICFTLHYLGITCFTLHYLGITCFTLHYLGIILMQSKTGNT
jgi:hypothetical protein